MAADGRSRARPCPANQWIGRYTAVQHSRPSVDHFPVIQPWGELQEFFPFMEIRCLLLGPSTALPERLRSALVASGFATEAMADAEAFQERARSGHCALGFLPYPWPSATAALDLLRCLRQVAAMPCVVVGTTPLPPGDRVAALEAGADEVLDAAMPLPEAIARLRAVLRRGGPAGIALSPAGPVWKLSPAIRQMQTPEGNTHRLTAAEFELLRLLMAASGQPVDRDTISRQAFRRPWQPEDRAVDGLVKRLRRKLGQDSVQTSRGLGYALTIEVRSM